MRTGDTINNIMENLRKYDRCTYEHSLRVGVISFIVGSEMKLEEQECNNLYIAGLLHDIGKMKIPKEIIQSKRKLSKCEYEFIKEHPVIGYNMIEKQNFNKNILDGILGHHERLDGSGYPHKLVDEDISLYARILGVVDSFDAMTSDRTYSKKISYREAICELNNKSKMYDKKVIDILEKYARGRYMYEQ